MKVHVLVSGPIRPSVESVLTVLRTIKEQVRPTTVLLLTWTGQLTEEIRREVDVVAEVPEPTESLVYTTVRTRTRQQREAAGALESWTVGMYRMVYGVQQVCLLARDYCAPDDIVIRLRTDAIFTFDPAYIPTILEHATRSYVVRRRATAGVPFDDWFAVTTYARLIDGWSFHDYATAVSNAWNAEDLVFTNVRSKGIPITYLDDDKMQCYLLRAGGIKHFYP